MGNLVRSFLLSGLTVAALLVPGAASAQDAPMSSNAAGPAGSLPPKCMELRKRGFTITQSSYSKSVTPPATMATQPRPGSFAPAPVAYGQKANNQMFLDSFPGVPKSGCRVCGVTVAVSGVIGGGNDGFGVIGSNNITSKQFNGAWGPNLLANSAHERLATGTPAAAWPLQSHAGD